MLLPLPRDAHRNPLATSYRRRGLTLVGMGVGGLLLWLAARNADLGMVAGVIASGHAGWLLAAGGVCAAGAGLRGWRWRVLLPPSGRPNRCALFRAIMLGNLANYVLPMRGGEVVRIWLAGRHGSTVGMLAGTVVLERVLDVLMVCGILTVAAAAGPIPTWLRLPLLLTAVAGLVALCVAEMMTKEEERVLSVVKRLLTRFHLGRFQVPIVIGLGRFLAAFRVLSDTGRLLVVTGISLVVWSGEALSTWLVLRSVGVDVGWLGCLLVLGLLALGMIVPTTPGALGTYEFMVVTALTAQGIDAVRALAGAVLLHAVSFSVTAVLGGFSLWSEGVSFGQLSRMARQEGCTTTGKAVMGLEGKQA